MPMLPSIFTSPILHELRLADRKAEQLRQEAKGRYDAHTKELPLLQVGDIVRVQHPQSGEWDLVAKVIKRHTRDRSYRVKSECGRIYRRNRRFLRLCLNPDQDQPVDQPGHDPASLQPRRGSRTRRAPDRYKPHK